MGGGGGSKKTYIKAAAPGVVAPIAPTRTSAEAMPENFDQAQFTSGVKRTDAENIQAGLGSSRLVIPIDEQNKTKTESQQAGGYTAPSTASSIVGKI